MVSQHPSVAPAGKPGLLAGQVVGGRFTCLGLIGEDRLGPLYRAQRVDGTHCVLQVLSPQRVGAGMTPGSRAGLRKEVERELRAAAGLHHPNIAPVPDVIIEDGAVYVVREALGGETLAQRLQRLGRPPVEAALDILERVASALKVAHRKGLCHLHLGPDKVFLQRASGQGDVVRVLDLGLWRLFGADPHGSPLIHPRYVAPEQIVSPRDVSANADVYVLGVLAFELLSGRLPFAANDPEVLLAQHVNDSAPTLADRAPDRLFSAELEGLISSMLAKAPQSRPRDAAAVMERLHELRQEGDLVIALDDREGQLVAEWPIAGASGSETAVGSRADADMQLEELPGLPDVYRAPGRRTTPAPGRPSRPQRPVEDARARRDLVGAHDGAQASEVLHAAPGHGEPAPPAIGAEPMRLERGAPPSAADALAQLLLPSSTGENETVSRPINRARAWLRQPVAIHRWRVPRGAVVGAGAVLLMGVLLLLILTGEEPARSGTTARAPAPPQAQRRPAGATPAARPMKPAARPSAPQAPAAAPPRKAEAPAPAPSAPVKPVALALALKPPTPVPAAPPSSPPGRFSVAAALGEPLRMPAPERAEPQRRHVHTHDAAARPANLPPNAVTVRIVSAPAGAQVWRSGQMLGTTPFSEAIGRQSKPLSYEVSRAGYETAKVEILPSQDRQVEVELSPIMVMK